MNCTIEGVSFSANSLHTLLGYFKCESNRRRLIFAGCAFLFLFLIFVQHRNKEQREETANFDSSTATPRTPTIRVAPTKWRIKITPTFAISTRLTPINSPKSLTNSCPGKSSVLMANIHAYISLNPPLPNRIHAAASLSSNYLGQIEPGRGLRLIDGPLCADGYSWWLVEANQSGLRGWTVEGKLSEQWIVPCPNPSIACSRIINQTPRPANSQHLSETKQPECISDTFAAGMLVQVEQDNLLILRSQPYTGEVIGRAGPLSVAKLIESPECTRNTIWWKLQVPDLGLTGWATEDGLSACAKDSECNLEAP